MFAVYNKESLRQMEYIPAVGFFCFRRFFRFWNNSRNSADKIDFCSAVKVQIAKRTGRSAQNR